MHKYYIDHIEFRVDDELVGTISTDDGYYKRGNFSGPNIWESGMLDAPFDQPVCLHFTLLQYNFYFVM